VENNDILIKVVPELSSYMRLNRFLLTRTDKALILLILPLFCVQMGIFSLISGEVGFGKKPFILAIFILILSFVINIFVVKFNFKESKFSTDTKKIIYVINENGIEMKTDIGSRTIKWKQVKKVYDTKYSFYIIYSVINDTSFNTEKQETIIIDKKFITEKQDVVIKVLLKDTLKKYCYKCKINKNKAIQYLNEAHLKQREDLLEKVESEDNDKNFDIEVTTKITGDLAIKFYDFSMFKGGNKVFLIVENLMYFLLAYPIYVKKGIDGILVLFCYWILWVPASVLIRRTIFKRNLKSGASNFYGINCEGITEITNSSKESYKWSQIYRVYETKDCFYMYVSKMQAFVISKADFKEGKLEEAKGIMNNKLTKKQNKLL